MKWAGEGAQLPGPRAGVDASAAALLADREERGGAGLAVGWSWTVHATTRNERGGWWRMSDGSMTIMREGAFKTARKGVAGDDAGIGSPVGCRHGEVEGVDTRAPDVEDAFGTGGSEQVSVRGEFDGSEP